MATQPTLAKAWIGLIPTLDGSTKQIQDELSDVDVDESGRSVGKKYGAAIGLGLVAASALIVKGLTTAVADASDLNESLNAVNVSYGDAAEGVLALSSNSANAIGLASADFNSLAVQFSSFSKTIAGEGGDVVSTLDDITGRAADFASVNNLEVADAAAKFQSALAGETEPLRAFGLDLSAATVEAYALANGIGDGTGALTEAEKVQARYGALMEQTSATAGDFANTQGDFANANRTLQANFTNLSATIGTAFLPALASVTTALIPVVEYLGENQSVLIAIAAVIGTTLVAAFVAWTVSIWASTVALLANPITWIILAVIALAAVIVLLVAKWDVVVEAIGKAWAWMQDIWSKGTQQIKDWAHDLWESITSAFMRGVNAVKDYLGRVGDFIKQVWSYSPLGLIVNNWDAILDYFKEIPTKIGNFFSGLADAITAPFKWAFNQVASLWNNTVGSLEFDIPDWVPGIGGGSFSLPKIPMLAQGALVTGPTLAVIGEGAHDEVVRTVPDYISDLREAANLGGGETQLSESQFDRLVKAIIDASTNLDHAAFASMSRSQAGSSNIQGRLA